jgi:hypothetical protein
MRTRVATGNDISKTVPNPNPLLKEIDPKYYQ